MNVRLFIIFWSDFVNREKNMILLSSVYNTDNSLTQDILCSTFGRFLIKKKKKEKFIHIQQLGLWKKCNWYHMTEINERKNIKDTLIETLWSWWFFTQEKITGKKQISYGYLNGKCWHLSVRITLPCTIFQC